MIASIEQAKKRLTDAGLYKTLHPLWTTLSWSEKKTQMAALEAEFYAPGTIIVYPGCGDETMKVRGILKAIGKAIEARMTPEARKCWDNRYALAEQAHIDSFNAALRTNPVTFRSIVERSQDPVERLTHIHLSNALIANKVTIRETENIDIKTWPPTAEFATQKRAYSLIPLASAYWPKGDTFAGAFESWVEDGLMDIYHTSVRKKIVELVQTTTEMVCSDK